MSSIFSSLFAAYNSSPRPAPTTTPPADESDNMPKKRTQGGGSQADPTADASATAAPDDGQQSTSRLQNVAQDKDLTINVEQREQDRRKDADARRNPKITKDDDDFTNAVEHFKGLLKKDGATPRSVVESQFMAHEQRMLFPADKADDNAMWQIQKGNSPRYAELRKPEGRFPKPQKKSAKAEGKQKEGEMEEVKVIESDEEQAEKMAMLWFGLPVEPLKGVMLEIGTFGDFAQQDEEYLADLELAGVDLGAELAKPPPLKFLNYYEHRSWGKETARDGATDLDLYYTIPELLPNESAPYSRETIKMMRDLGLPIPTGHNDTVGLRGGGCDDESDSTSDCMDLDAGSDVEYSPLQDADSSDMLESDTSIVSATAPLCLRGGAYPTMADDEATDADIEMEDVDMPDSPPLRSAQVSLRGGAGSSKRKADISSPFTKSPTPAEKWVPLYGYQGKVHFKLNNRSTFIDALVRLLGIEDAGEDAEQTPHVTLHIFNRPRKRVLKKTIQFSWNDIGLERFENLMDQVDGAADKFAVFATARGDQPPADHWEPDEKKLGELRVMKCQLDQSADDTRGDVAYIRVPDRGDTAYVHMPENVWQLTQLNIYQPWIMAVCRILSPGQDAGKPGSPAVPRVWFKTTGQGMSYGGLSLSKWAWIDICKTFENGEHELKCSLHSVQEKTTALYLPGWNVMDLTDASIKWNDSTKKLPFTKMKKWLQKMPKEYYDKIAGIDVWFRGEDILDPDVPAESFLLTDVALVIDAFSKKWDEYAKEGSSRFISFLPCYKEYTALTRLKPSEKFKQCSWDANKFLKAGDFRTWLEEAGFETHKPVYIDFFGEGTSKGDMLEESPEFRFGPSTTDDEWAIILRQIIYPTFRVQPVLDVDRTRPEVVDAELWTRPWGWRDVYDSVALFDKGKAPKNRRTKDREFASPEERDIVPRAQPPPLPVIRLVAPEEKGIDMADAVKGGKGKKKKDSSPQPGTPAAGMGNSRSPSKSGGSSGRNSRSSSRQATDPPETTQNPVEATRGVKKKGSAGGLKPPASGNSRGSKSRTPEPSVPREPQPSKSRSKRRWGEAPGPEDEPEEWLVYFEEFKQKTLADRLKELDSKDKAVADRLKEILQGVGSKAPVPDLGTESSRSSETSEHQDVAATENAVVSNVDPSFLSQKELTTILAEDLVIAGLNLDDTALKKLLPFPLPAEPTKTPEEQRQAETDELYGGGEHIENVNRRNDKLRYKSYADVLSIFDLGARKPQIPIHGFSLESFIKTPGDGPPPVSRAILTPTEASRLNAELHSMRTLQLDRVERCPFNCGLVFPRIEQDKLYEHVENVHMLERCNLCKDYLYKSWNKAQRMNHFLSKHSELFANSDTHLRDAGPSGEEGKKLSERSKKYVDEREVNWNYCARCGRDHRRLYNKVDRAHHDSLCNTWKRMRRCRPRGAKKGEFVFCAACGLHKDERPGARPHVCDKEHDDRPYCYGCGLGLRHFSPEYHQSHKLNCRGVENDHEDAETPNAAFCCWCGVNMGRTRDEAIRHLENCMRNEKKLEGPINLITREDFESPKDAIKDLLDELNASVGDVPKDKPAPVPATPQGPAKIPPGGQLPTPDNSERGSTKKQRRGKGKGVNIPAPVQEEDEEEEEEQAGEEGSEFEPEPEPEKPDQEEYEVEEPMEEELPAKKPKPTVDYSNWRGAALREECLKRKLSVIGQTKGKNRRATNAEMIQRLEDDDEAKANAGGDAVSQPEVEKPGEGEPVVKMPPESKGNGKRGAEDEADGAEHPTKRPKTTEPKKTPAKPAPQRKVARTPRRAVP